MAEQSQIIYLLLCLLSIGRPEISKINSEKKHNRFIVEVSEDKNTSGTLNTEDLHSNIHPVRVVR